MNPYTIAAALQSSTEITTILKIKSAGKWLELWTDKPRLDNGDWDRCTKAGRFWDAVEKADLYDYILNHGAQGLKLIWTQNNPNGIWEIERIEQ